MKPNVYIETTIVGHLTSRLSGDSEVALQMLATRKWWNNSRQQFDLVTSDITLMEASRGDPVAAAERLTILKDIPLVPVTDTAQALAELLVDRHALPTKARVDALHLAIAATNLVPYLLTWNCRHLANATLRVRINEVCRIQGHEAPIICTPLELPEVLP